MQGTLLLLAYSLGLGVPFFLSALLIQKLKGALDWVKAHYSAVNTVCGVSTAWQAPGSVSTLSISSALGRVNG